MPAAPRTRKKRPAERLGPLGGWNRSGFSACPAISPRPTTSANCAGQLLQQTVQSGRARSGLLQHLIRIRIDWLSGTLPPFPTAGCSKGRPASWCVGAMGRSGSPPCRRVGGGSHPPAGLSLLNASRSNLPSGVPPIDAAEAPADPERPGSPGGSEGTGRQPCKLASRAHHHP